MKFEINRELMREAAKNVATVAPPSSTQILSNILLECNEDTGEVFLTATNHEVTIQQKIMTSVEESGSILVPPRMLKGMLSLLESEFVAFSSAEQERLKVTGGRCTYRIACQSAKGYPKPVMPFPDECAIMTGVCSLAKRTTFAIGTDPHKLALQCVNVKIKNNAVHAEASDSIKMMLVKDSAEPTVERQFMLPGRALKMLASISTDEDVFEVGEIGNTIVFVRGDMIFTVCKLAAGEFMDTAAVIKNFKPEYTALTEAAKMKDALSFLTVAASIGDMPEPLNIVLARGEIRLRFNNDYSEADSVVPAKVPKETPDSGFLYDISALAKLFQVVSGNVKMEVDANGFMLIKTRSEVYFQSPVRAVAKKSKPLKLAKEPKEKSRAKGAKDMKDVA
jgi:DNA polymerase III sliding clamp (beta) subunit (PCNA family)